MTKRELVIQVAEQLGYTQNEVANVVQATLDAIADSLAQGHRIEVRNFGVFEVKTRDARIGRNPRTGEQVPISEKRVATKWRASSHVAFLNLSPSRMRGLMRRSLWWTKS